MMKRFVDEKGTFEINIPITWKYSLKSEKVHTFQEYDIWKSDAFQLSIIELKSDEQKLRHFNSIKSLPVIKLGDLYYTNYPEVNDGEFIIKAWSRLFDNKFVLFTLNHSNAIDEDLDNRSIDDKVQIVETSIKEFRLIDEAKKAATIRSYRFDMFLQGVGATVLMLNKAVKNKAFIEATCVIASQIDALLRIGIILRIQTLKRNSYIETEWIYQGLSDKKKSEKDIYKKALELKIIDQDVFDNLYRLYDERNRVIHRFIISEITLADVENISYKYYQKLERINEIIYDIETEQINLNVGMTVNGNSPNEPNYLDYIIGKIGKIDYFEAKE